MVGRLPKPFDARTRIVAAAGGMLGVAISCERAAQGRVGLVAGFSCYHGSRRQLQPYRIQRYLVSVFDALSVYF